MAETIRSMLWKGAISGFALLLLMMPSAFADETVRTEDGRTILLKDDGTYQVVERAQSEGEVSVLAFGDFIFDATAGGVVYAKDAHDLSNRIIKELNKGL